MTDNKLPTYEEIAKEYPQHNLANQNAFYRNYIGGFVSNALIRQVEIILKAKSLENRTYIEFSSMCRNIFDCECPQNAVDNVLAWLKEQGFSYNQVIDYKHKYVVAW